MALREGEIASALETLDDDLVNELISSFDESFFDDV